MTSSTASPAQAPQNTLTRGLVLLFAFCCGAIVANIYYAQPIVELIAPEIGLSAHSASLIVSLTQIGYALGLLFLVPLADLLENRKLMIGTAIVATASLLAAAFSLFWTAAPIELSRTFGLSQTQIALFALVGAIGAIAAPVAGRLADAGHTRRASLIAMIMAPVAFLVGLSQPGYSVIGLAVTGVLLDFAVQMNMVLGQRAIYALDPASRGRLNALYMTSIFIGGAIGSALASSLYEQSGWHGVVWLGAGLPLAALVVFLLSGRVGRGS